MTAARPQRRHRATNGQPERQAPEGVCAASAGGGAAAAGISAACVWYILHDSLHAHSTWIINR